jgi:hypothetical protein
MHRLLDITLLQMERLMTTITLTLPEQTMEQAQQAAAALQRPVEDVLRDLLAAVLPTMPDVPDAMQAELIRMTWLDSQELWRIAREQMSAAAQAQLQQLTHLQGQRPLTPDEQAQLDALRRAYGRMTLLKARAYAILSLRGGEPLLRQV